MAENSTDEPDKAPAAANDNVTHVPSENKNYAGAGVIALFFAMVIMGVIAFANRDLLIQTKQIPKIPDSPNIFITEQFGNNRLRPPPTTMQESSDNHLHAHKEETKALLAEHEIKISGMVDAALDMSEARLDDYKALTAETIEINETLMALKKQVDEQAETIAQLRTALAEARTPTDQEASKMALRLAWSQLDRAILAHGDFEKAYTHFVNEHKNHPTLQIEKFALTAYTLPTTDVLVSLFAKADDTFHKGGNTSSLMQRLSSLIDIRKIEAEEEANDVESVVARARAAIADKDTLAAAGELASLEDEQHEIFRDFTEAVERRSTILAWHEATEALIFRYITTVQEVSTAAAPTSPANVVEEE